MFALRPSLTIAAMSRTFPIPMNTRVAQLASIAFLACAGLLCGTARAEAPLELLGSTVIAGYAGDFDHLAADVRGNRLFLAGEEQGSLLVFDLASGALHKTVKAFDQPHAIHYARDAGRLFVTDSGKGLTKVLDAKSYRVVGRVKLASGADVMAHDPSTGHLWIVSGGKNATPKLPQTFVNEVDPATGAVLGSIPFDTDFTEGIVAEQHGSRIFVNVAGRSQIAVLDKNTRAVLARW